MNRYLLDTNICIYYIKGKYELDKKFHSVSPSNIFISVISLAELMFGVKNSSSPEKNRLNLELFLTKVQILPIFDSLEIYSSEKTRLRKLGTPIDEFDLLIGATAISNDMIMVTNNTKHFERLLGISIENWTLDKNI